MSVIINWFDDNKNKKTNTVATPSDIATITGLQSYEVSLENTFVAMPGYEHMYVIPSQVPIPDGMHSVMNKKRLSGGFMSAYILNNTKDYLIQSSEFIIGTEGNPFFTVITKFSVIETNNNSAESSFIKYIIYSLQIHEDYLTGMIQISDTSITLTDYTKIMYCA